MRSYHTYCTYIEPITILYVLLNRLTPKKNRVQSMRKGRLIAINHAHQIRGCSKTEFVVQNMYNVQLHIIYLNANIC